MPANFYFIKTACAQRNFCPLTPHTQSFSPLNFFIAIGRFAEGAYPSTAPAFRRELSFLCVSIRRKFLLTPRMLRVVISFSSFSSSLLFRRLFSEVFSAARIFKSLFRSLMLFCFPLYREAFLYPSRPFPASRRLRSVSLPSPTSPPTTIYQSRKGRIFCFDVAFSSRRKIFMKIL